MVIGPPLVKPLLRLLDTPASLMTDCTYYLIIMMIGLSGMAYYNILSGVLRGMGD